MTWQHRPHRFTHLHGQVHISTMLYQQLYQVLSAVASSIEQRMSTMLHVINSNDNYYIEVHNARCAATVMHAA